MSQPDGPVQCVCHGRGWLTRAKLCPGEAGCVVSSPGAHPQGSGGAGRQAFSAFSLAAATRVKLG